jgi:hypothetical protein
MKGYTAQMKAVANGKVVENKLPRGGATEKPEGVDTDMKVRLTRVEQMTSPGMSRCPRRPHISSDRACDYESTGNHALPKHTCTIRVQTHVPGA